MDSPCSTASWRTLATLRRRGVRPSGGIWVTDDPQQRRNLEASGVFAVGLPRPEEAYLIAGLGVTLLAQKTVRTIEAAHMLASAHPSMMVVLWDGEHSQLVIE